MRIKDKTNTKHHHKIKIEKDMNYSEPLPIKISPSKKYFISFHHIKIFAQS